MTYLIIYEKSLVYCKRGAWVLVLKLLKKKKINFIDTIFLTHRIGFIAVSDLIDRWLYAYHVL